MGFDLQAVRFLFDAKQAGTDFSEALMLGRQNLHIDRRIYRREAERFSLTDPDEVAAFSSAPYAEGLLQSLGSHAPASLDAHAFEQATHIADLNRPLPDELSGRFSLVIDGGTLEHVFDFRQAATNVGKLLRVGGHFLSITCCNNFSGHGFYQFSPELFFRVFAPANGFEVETMIVAEVNGDGAWYEVSDPAVVRSRVEFMNNTNTYLMCRARKVADVEMFAAGVPQQSDYQQNEWEAEDRQQAETYVPDASGIAGVVTRHFPQPARSVLRRIRQATRAHYASPQLRLVRSF